MKRHTTTSLFLLLVGSTVLAAPLPRLTFIPSILGGRIHRITSPAWKEPVMGYTVPRHASLKFGSGNKPTGTLDVYDIREVLKANPRNTDLRDEIERLRALLVGRTAPANLQGEMPSFPPGPPPEFLHAAVKYVNFPGGRGVRYVAAYSFAASPVVRSQVSYVFQGLTNDGKYLVSWGQQVTLKKIPTDYDTTPVLRRVQEDIFGV